MSTTSPLQVTDMDNLSSGQVQCQQTEDDLESFWQRGMCSRRSKLIEEASSKTGLGIREIKKWISNKKKRVQRAIDKENGVEPKKREKTPLRKKRGYDLFMSERLNQEDLKSLGIEKRSEKLSRAQQAWRELSDDEKDEWNKKAESLPITIEETTRIENKVSKLEAKCSELWAIGVSVTLLTPDGTGSFRIHAPPETKRFWTENEDAPVLQAYADELRSSKTTAAPKNADRLRREIQNLFNLRYEEATGKKRSCNYVEMDLGQIVAQGMPEGIELKRPGMYNKPEKEAILEKADGIRFEVRDMQNMEVQESGEDVSTLNGQNQAVTDETAPAQESNVDRDSQVPPMDSPMYPEWLTVHEVEIQGVPLEEGRTDQAETIDSTIVGPVHSDDDVTDFSTCTAEEAMKRAALIAREWENKTSQTKMTSRKKKQSTKKCYMSSLVGKRVKQLWTLQDKTEPAKWFFGTIMQGNYRTFVIKFDDEEQLHPLTAATTKHLLKKKTLCFI